MPDLSKMAGLIWDMISDYFFAVSNAKIRPQLVSTLGVDKIRAAQISGVVLTAILSVAIQAMIRAEQYQFDGLIFLLSAFVYLSIVGAAFSGLLGLFGIINGSQSPTHDALTVVIGFALLAETILLPTLFALQSFVSLKSSLVLGAASAFCVLCSAGIGLTRSERKTFGAGRLSALLLFLALAIWPFLRYVVLKGLAG